MFYHSDFSRLSSFCFIIQISPDDFASVLSFRFLQIILFLFSEISQEICSRFCAHYCLVAKKILGFVSEQGKPKRLYFLFLAFLIGSWFLGGVSASFLHFMDFFFYDISGNIWGFPYETRGLSGFLNDEQKSHVSFSILMEDSLKFHLQNSVLLHFFIFWDLHSLF